MTALRRTLIVVINLVEMSAFMGSWIFLGAMYLREGLRVETFLLSFYFQSLAIYLRLMSRDIGRPSSDSDSRRG